MSQVIYTANMPGRFYDGNDVPQGGRPCELRLILEQTKEEKKDDIRPPVVEFPKGMLFLDSEEDAELIKRLDKCKFKGVDFDRIESIQKKAQEGQTVQKQFKPDDLVLREELESRGKLAQDIVDNKRGIVEPEIPTVRRHVRMGPATDPSKNEAPERPLAKMNMGELRKEAKKVGVKAPVGTKKAELVDAIEKARSQ